MRWRGEIKHKRIPWNEQASRRADRQNQERAGERRMRAVYRELQTSYPLQVVQRHPGVHGAGPRGSLRRPNRHTERLNDMDQKDVNTLLADSRDFSTAEYSEPCMCGATDCPRCNPQGQTLTPCGRCWREVKAHTLEVAQCGKVVCGACYEACDSCEDNKEGCE